VAWNDLLWTQAKVIRNSVNPVDPLPWGVCILPGEAVDDLLSCLISQPTAPRLCGPWPSWLNGSVEARPGAYPSLLIPLCPHIITTIAVLMAAHCTLILFVSGCPLVDLSLLGINVLRAHVMLTYLCDYWTVDYARDVLSASILLVGAMKMVTFSTSIAWGELAVGVGAGPAWKSRTTDRMLHEVSSVSVYAVNVLCVCAYIYIYIYIYVSCIYRNKDASSMHT